MRMALLWIVDIRIHTTLKDLRIIARLRGLATSGTGKVDVHESRNVAEVENASITEFDRLFKQLLLRNHALSDAVPCGPEVDPVNYRRDRMCSVFLGLNRIGDLWSVQEMQR